MVGKISCAICNKRCRGTVLKIDTFYLHKTCFKCQKCGKALDEKNFQLRDKCFYCPEDYKQEFSVKCAGCGNPVEGEVVTALGSTFHTFCLRCFSCNRTIVPGEKAVALSDRFYCERCSPPQVAEEADEEGDWDLACSVADPQSTPSPPPPPANGMKKKKRKKKKKPDQPRVPKSASLPRRLGDFFRTRKSPSRDPQASPSPHHATLTNGTAALSVNVGEHDATGADSEIGKKFYQSQSPSYSLYSGDNMILSKSREIQSTPAESCPLMTHSAMGTGEVAYSIDPALTTPSMVNALSGDTSTLLYGSVRRICPPGVDYGRQYPVSYLRLAEQGYTAVISTDDLNSESLSPSPCLSRLPPCYSGPCTQRMSRRDLGRQTRTLPIAVDSPAFSDKGQAERPEKDRYTRYRQMSPTPAVSAGRATSSGRCATTPGSNFTVRKSQTYSFCSTPNVNSRRAEMMMKSPRAGRSVSPEAALMAQAEARRLAAYPGAKVPDANSEPAIDRYDWPAPPSPAVVLIDRRREKALKSTTLPDGATVTSEGSSSDTRTLSPGTEHSLSPEKDHPTCRMEAKITTLKRATGNSGMSAAVAQYVEEDRKHGRDGSPDLDPISASRSPNASFEPPYSTRYTNHRFASPSRFTLRRHPALNSPTGTDVFSTSPISSPRPGYTSGILSSRPVSLPRQVNGTATATHYSTSTSPWSPDQRRFHVECASRTLPVNGVPAGLNGSQNGDASLATSGLSMNGFAPTTDSLSHRTRSSTLTGGLPPPSISGLRPVGRSCLGSRGRSRWDNGWSTERSVQCGSPSPHSLAANTTLDNQYLDVQSWLRPSAAQSRPQPTTYSYDQLRISSDAKLRGIDSQHREAYLSSGDFERLFKMTRLEFQRLPAYKQNDLKRRLDLY
uniref:HP domain-containing protein n=1 Tax=Mesocestoides corti TaxID=53468 RepID=A0A5K3FNQ8_MESCO